MKMKGQRSLFEPGKETGWFGNRPQLPGSFLPVCLPRYSVWGPSCPPGYFPAHLGCCSRGRATLACRQAGRQADKQIDRQMERQTARHMLDDLTSSSSAQHAEAR